jgi:hypothetical protein
MVPLTRAADTPRASGARSLLISGGCDPDGRVPLAEHAEEIAAIRQNRRLNWHVGLAGELDLASVAAHDVVSFDLPVSDHVLRASYGLDRSFGDYLEMYRRLRKRFVVVPHITVGLDQERPEDEMAALEALAGVGASALVVLVFTPTRGTLFASRLPPPPVRVTSAITAARRLMPDSPVGLGCMRPGGAYRALLDPMALAAGANWIVNPAREAVRYAQLNGFEVEQSFECCIL